MNKPKKDYTDLNKPIVVMPEGMLGNLSLEAKKSLAAKADVDFGNMKDILNGEKNCSIGSLENLIEAFGYQYVLYPVPTVPLLTIFLRQHADNLPYFWRMTNEAEYGQIFNFLPNSVGRKFEGAKMHAVAYEINAVLGLIYSQLGDNEEVIQRSINFKDHLIEFAMSKIGEKHTEENSTSK